MGVLNKLHKQHIRGSKYEVLVTLETVFLCHLTKTVQRNLKLNHSKVYVSTKMLKHLYDKRPAEEYEFIIKNLHTVVKYPDSVYKNKDSKRGDLCLIKEIRGDKYICSIEIRERTEDGNPLPGNHVATSFRMRKERYLNSYKLVWNWKGDTPSS